MRVLIVAALVAVVVTAADCYSDARDPNPHLGLQSKKRLSQQCAGYCKASSKFKLQPSATYVYNYEGATTTGVVGTSNDTSEIKIVAEAHIQAMESSCELILQLRNSQLYDSGDRGMEFAERHREFSKILEENPLRFSYQDGRIEQLCPSVDEPSWVLNIKRGLLSAFQNSMVDFTKDAHLYERDVSGSCETTYSVRPLMWTDIKVVRHKNLQTCTGRGYQTLGLPGTFSKLKSIPIIKSEQVCEQTIRTEDGTLLTNTKCKETHLFAPFSNGRSGIKTTATLSLRLDRVVPNSDPIVTELFVNKRSTLQFDFNEAGEEESTSVENVWDTLYQLTKDGESGITRDMPHLFNLLVSQLSVLDDQQLTRLFDEQRDKKARKFLLDALPLVGSPGSVFAMYQIYQAREVTRDELDSWLTMLAFHKQPSLGLLQSLNVFVEGGFHPRAWLAISSVVHAYCQQDSACADKLEVQQIMSHIENALGDSCFSATSEHQQKILIALKAIGNAGLIKSLQTLEKCFLNDHSPMEVRLAAFSATRRFSCRKVKRLPILQIFQDQSQDTELRIAAYLAALQCPNTAVVSRLRDALYKEDTNQVLSFVWTHLTNLQESTSSWRKEVREMLQDNYLANKFKTDVRKFSRNFETSFYSDSLNTGATVDSNIVFSTKSYLPRSATLNLTLDLFGEAVNVFEVGTRMEGFESMVEDIFSEKGVFPDDSMQKMLKNMRNANDEKNEVIHSFSDQFTKGTVNEPQGSIFTRVLGNELYFTQFNSLNKLLNPKSSDKYSIKSLIGSLSLLFNNNHIDCSKSFRVINTKYRIPTVLGLPLKLEVNGTATVGMHLESEVDLNDIFKTKSGSISLFINPSAAMQVDGKMIIDAVFAQAGIETKGTLSSNTYLDAKLTVEKGQVIDMSLNVPRDKVEVINVTSEIFIKRRNKLVEIEGVGEVTSQDTCSGKHISTISGMRACSQIIVRNASAVEESPYFPLTGKFQYALALLKSDDFSAYEVHFKQMFQSTNEKYSGKFLMEIDTPGSMLNRRLLADLSFNTSNGDANLQLTSPIGSFAFFGRLGLTAVDKSIDLKAQVNGEDYAALKMALQADTTANAIRFEPTLLLQARPNLNFNVTGRLNIVPGNKYSADLTALGFTKTPIALSGDVSAVKGHYSGSFSAQAEAVDIKVLSRIVSSPSTFSCKTTIRYVLPQKHSTLQNGVDFAVKLQNHKKGGFTKRHLLINLQITELPDYSTKANWILYHNNRYVDCNMDLMVGKTQWKSQQLFHNNLQEKNKNFEVILSLESPTKDLDYRAEVQYKTTEDTVHGHALAQLNKQDQFISRLDCELALPRQSLELEITSPWKGALIEARLEFLQESGSEWVQPFKGSLLAKWGDKVSPEWVSITGLYKLEQTFMSAKHSVEGKLEGGGWVEPLLVEGEWFGRSSEGLILVDSWFKLVVNKETYKVLVGYKKDPMEGLQDWSVDLNLPKKSYSSNLVMINNEEVKNVTARIDLEKTIYFTAQVHLWSSFESKLFWNYVEDSMDAVVVKYKSSSDSEIAVFSMPGHFASITVNKLGPGYSSMNVTAIWGEHESVANNAILLYTFWLFDTSSWYAEELWLPVIQTRVHLITPFLGFEQQSFELNMNGSVDSYSPFGNVARDIQVSAKWQEQFINLKYKNYCKYKKTVWDQYDIATTHRATLSSSLQTFKEANINVVLQVEDVMAHYFLNKVLIKASYNSWADFALELINLQESTTFSSHILNKAQNSTLFSGDLNILKDSVTFESTIPNGKKILFSSKYDWPRNFVASLKTPFQGYEESAVQYQVLNGGDEVKCKVYGLLNKNYMQALVNLGRSQFGFAGELNVSSSSSLADLFIKVEHELKKNKEEMSIKELAHIVLSKNGKTVQTGLAKMSFTDAATSTSSKSKTLQTVLELPGYHLTTNYLYRSQVKTSGVEIHHTVMHSWNNVYTEMSLKYEGLSSISAIVNRNNKKEGEFVFKNFGNRDFRTDLSVGKYSLKHRFYFEDLLAWENSFMVSSQSKKFIVKNIQSVNSERTNLEHTTVVNSHVPNEISSFDLVVNLDKQTNKVDSIMFSITTPWNYPFIAEYNLLVDTGATKKHELQLKFKQNQEIKALIDSNFDGLKYDMTFLLNSPYCKNLKGNLQYQFNERIFKGGAFLETDWKKIIAELELEKSMINPSLILSLNDTNKSIISLSWMYNIANEIKEAKFVTSYFEQEVKLKGHYSTENNKIKSGVLLKTPFTGWKDVSVSFDSVLSQKYSMFVLSTSKDEQYATISGTGTFENSLLRGSLSIDYMTSVKPQKQSVFYEFSKSRDNVFAIFKLAKNEENIVILSMNFLKDESVISGKVHHSFAYKSHLPIETMRDSSLYIESVKNNRQHIFNGNVTFNNWESSITGDSTINDDGNGHLFAKFLSPENEFLIYVKHVTSENNDIYSWNLSGNGNFTRGYIMISNMEEHLWSKFEVESTIKEFETVKGIIDLQVELQSLNFGGSLNLNNDKYTLTYNVSFQSEISSKTRHLLKIEIPGEFSSKLPLIITANCEYEINGLYLSRFDGLLSDGKTSSKVNYWIKMNNDFPKWKLNVDLSDLFNLSVQQMERNVFEFLAKNIESESVPKFLMSLKVNSTGMEFETINYVTKRIKLIGAFRESTFLLSSLANDVNSKAVLEIGEDFLNAQFTSNIENWKEISILIKRKMLDKVNITYAVSISKERKELIYATLEGFHNNFRGEQIVTITMGNYFADINLNYDFSSDFSVEVSYSINGKKQQAKGKFSFLPASARIDLATPIRGYEDMTMIGSFNKKSKKGGLMLNINGRVLEIDISTTLEKGLAVIKGSVSNGDDEFILSVGVQNGTIDDPSFLTVFVKTFKNKQIMFWLSLEGSFDIVEKAGLKVSFSSQNYKQLYFEISSLRKEMSHTLLFNYLYGIDVVYLLRTTIIGDIYKPKLTIDSQFGPETHYFEIGYKIIGSNSSVAVIFKQNKDKYIHLVGEMSLMLQASNFEFELANEGIFSGVDSVLVFGEYNFLDKSRINTTFILNNIQYFDLFMESLSLYNIKFQSALKQSMYINMFYDVALLYNFSMPTSKILSKINVNGDYYMCTANLTWDSDTAETFFQLSTNGGYGFKDSLFVTKYEKKNKSTYCHLINFAIDDSVLFNVASKIYYPNMLSVDVVLPNSFFLHPVKNISVFYNFTEKEKTAYFKYTSDSNNKEQFNILSTLAEESCTIEVYRSKTNELNHDQIDHFKISYSSNREGINFLTFLEWGNVNIFSASYNKSQPELKNKMLLLYLFFNVDSAQFWNITAGSEKDYEFVGNLSPSDFSLKLKHPLTNYHKNYLSKVILTKTLGSKKYLEVQYTSDKTTEINMMYSDFTHTIATIMSDDKNGISSTDVIVVYKDRNIKLHHEDICEDLKHCLKYKYSLNVSGLSEKPITFSFVVDKVLGEIAGGLNLPSNSYMFGGKAEMNFNIIACSNIQIFLNSSSFPEKPFAFLYETNCQDRFYVGVNFFEKTTQKVRVNIDHNKKEISGFSVQATNTPWIKDINMSGHVLDNSLVFSANFHKDFVHFHLNMAPDDTFLTLESSYPNLKILEVRKKINEANGNVFGKLKLKSLIASTEWTCEMSRTNDGNIVFHVLSDKDIQVIVNVSNKKEIAIQLYIGIFEKFYEGKGSIKYSLEDMKFSAESRFNLDGKSYKLLYTFEKLKANHEFLIKLETPNDVYYIDSSFSKTSDFKSSLITFKYKTPIQTIEFGDLSVKYSLIPVTVNEVFSLKELGKEHNVESYNLTYKKIHLSIFFKTETINFDEAAISILYGDKYGTIIHSTSETIEITLSRFQNNHSMAFEGAALTQIPDVQGKNIHIDKSTLKSYLNFIKQDAFVSVESPLIESILIYTKCTDCKQDYVQKSTSKTKPLSGNNRTSEITFGNKSLLKLMSHKNSKGLYQGNLQGNWNNKYVLNFNYKIALDDLQIEFKIDTQNQSIVDTEVNFKIKNSGNMNTKSMKLNVNKWFSIQPFYPSLVFSKEAHNSSIVNYGFNFTNGLNYKGQSLKGSLFLKLLKTDSFSIAKNSSLNLGLNLSTYSKVYECNSIVYLKQNQIDSEINWRQTELLKKVEKVPEFYNLRFGALLQNKSVELYLNENKLSGVLNISNSTTSVSAALVNEKEQKNITMVASLQFSPIFSVRVFHTLFESPCVVEVKVFRKHQSLESAITVIHNNLHQQGIVNVYLDSNPKYAELMYNDVWDNTHEASIHIEQKDDEVTVKGKINSPALDENFIIFTVGHNNDKLDLNLSDLFIFKAFKDSSSGYIDAFVFDNNYKLRFVHEEEVQISIFSPNLSGKVNFKMNETSNEAYLYALFDVDYYHFLLDINRNNAFAIVLTKEKENILDTHLEYENGSDFFQVLVQCNIFKYFNTFSLKHTNDPMLLVISLKSPYYLQNNLDIVLGMENTDKITGIFEIKDSNTLLKSCLSLDKQNRTFELAFEAPLFSEMDKAKISGVFNIIDDSDCDIKFLADLISTDTMIAGANFNFVKNDEVISSSLVLKSTLNNYENIELSFHLPVQISRDMKIVMKLQFPAFNLYQVSASVCTNEVSKTSSVIAVWPGFRFSAEFKNGVTAFYSDVYEWNLHYQKNKLQIVAWMKPKDPVTDNIYFVNLNEKRIVEISHAFVLQENHFKSKLILETIFKNHEKYGINLELQNLKIGKIVKVLGSAPHYGKDVGIDFAYSYESMLNYAVLAQIKVPYNNKIKTAKINSMNKFHPKLEFIKFNHSLECSELGVIGWEFESIGLVPFVWLEKLSSVESTMTLNSNVLSVKTKWFLQPNKLQLSFGVKAPFDIMSKADLQFAGTLGSTTSELIIVLNSHELLNASITKDENTIKQAKFSSEWSNMVANWDCGLNNGVKAYGYICWDLKNRNSSQLGFSFKKSTNDGKKETQSQLILPSLYLPKLSFRTAIKSIENDLFSLVEVELPGLKVEGKIAHDVTLNLLQTGMEIKWTTELNATKNMGLFYVLETNEDEINHNIILQHFALANDLSLIAYNKNNVYGTSLQYSPLKEEEIIIEFGHWFVEDGDTERSGIKFVVLHHATNTLIYGVANLTSSSEYFLTAFSVSYLSSSESKKIEYIEVFGKKSKKSPDIFVGLASNGNSLGVGGSIWKKENHLRGLIIEARVNQKDPFKLELVQNVFNSGVEAELSYSLGRTYRFVAGMPNSNELTTKLSHTTYGKLNLDAMASLRLNTSRTLWGRFELPSLNQVSQEFYNGITEEYFEACLVSQAVGSGFANFLREDFSEKITLLLNAASVHSNILINQTTVEIENLGKAFEAMQNGAKKLYEEDDFYVRTLYHWCKGLGDVIQKHASCALEVITDVFRSLVSPVSNVGNRLWEVVQNVLLQWKTLVSKVGVAGVSPIKYMSGLVESYQTLRLSVVQYCQQLIATTRSCLNQLELKSADLLAKAELSINQLTRAVEQALTTQVQKLVDFRDTMLAGFSILQETVKEMVDIVFDGMYRIKEVRFTVSLVVQCIDSINSWYTDFRLETYFTEIDTFVEKVAQLIVSDFKKNFGEYEVYVERAKLLLSHHYQELNKLPEFRYFQSGTNLVYQKVKWFWNYARLSEKVKEAVKRYVNNIKAVLDELQNQLNREDSSLRSEYNYNEENNSFTFTQELPFEWKSFTEMPNYNVEFDAKALSLPALDYGNTMQTMANYIWQDAKMLPYLLPPFGADALLSGDSFITFDSSYYRFGGDCNSYLLAADLYHNTFSLIANFSQQRRKDLVLSTQGTEILIKDNLEVTVNGKHVDLPMKLQNGKLLKLERKVHSILIDSEDGFSLECSSFQDQCRLHLSGWYMGKTAGLFGTFNNEPLDDFTTPSRQQVLSVKEFTDSWAVDTKSCENGDEISSSSEDARPFETMCDLLFSSQSSPFYPCFSVVNPKAFLNMCLGKSQKDNTCGSMMAYVTKCTFSGVQLWLPETCVDTSIPNATLLSGYADTVDVPVEQSVDVVFVEEKADCMKTEHLKVGALAASLNSAFKTKGLTSNRFALVSFDSMDAQLHTIKGQIWTETENFLAVSANHLEKEETTPISSSSMYSSALDLAASMPFRPGASKVVILSHCSGCSFTDSYASILERFLGNDITLHILQKENIMGKKGKMVSKAIGLEKSGAYPRKRLNKNTLANPQLLQQVMISSDMCSPIMLDTNGTLFHVDVIRKALKLWTGRVAEGAVPSSHWRHCEHIVGRDNVPVWQCRESSRTTKLKIWDQTAIAEYMDVSHHVDVSDYEEAD